MATSKKLSEREQVSQFISGLDPGTASIVETIRNIILTADDEIGEQIKWNHPCFYYKGEMKPFNPKEYKREIAVFNLHKGRILLVFPTGAKINDHSGLLEGDYKDGRRIVVLKDADDVKQKKTLLQQVIKKWIDLVEK